MDDRIAALLAKQPQFRHFVSFIERGGWFSADNFLTWMATRLDSAVYRGSPREFGGMTLAQFYAATQVDFSLVASDMTGECLLVLNHRTAPACPVLWAVRMSMNIPLVWQEVVAEEGDCERPSRSRDRGWRSAIELSDGAVCFQPALCHRGDGAENKRPCAGILIDETLPVGGAWKLLGEASFGLAICRRCSASCARQYDAAGARQDGD